MQTASKTRNENQAADAPGRIADNSSMFGWKILLTKPIEGDLYG
jgi:hypothetical protein